MMVATIESILLYFFFSSVILLVAVFFLIAWWSNFSVSPFRRIRAKQEQTPEQGEEESDLAIWDRELKEEESLFNNVGSDRLKDILRSDGVCGRAVSEVGDVASLHDAERYRVLVAVRYFKGEIGIVSWNGLRFEPVEKGRCCWVIKNLQCLPRVVASEFNNAMEIHISSRFFLLARDSQGWSIYQQQKKELVKRFLHSRWS